MGIVRLFLVTNSLAQQNLIPQGTTSPFLPIPVVDNTANLEATVKSPASIGGRQKTYWILEFCVLIWACCASSPHHYHFRSSLYECESSQSLYEWRSVTHPPFTKITELFSELATVLVFSLPLPYHSYRSCFPNYWFPARRFWVKSSSILSSLQLSYDIHVPNTTTKMRQQLRKNYQKKTNNPCICVNPIHILPSTARLQRLHQVSPNDIVTPRPYWSVWQENRWWYCNLDWHQIDLFYLYDCTCLQNDKWC